MKAHDNLEVFLYWLQERERIRHLREYHGEPAPWTVDKILQQYKFTNVFRQDDRTTRAVLFWLEWARKHHHPPLEEVLFNIIVFRLFNHAGTFNALGWQRRYNQRNTMRKLQRRKLDGKKIFTGAYVVTNAGQRRSKIDLYAEALGRIWSQRKALTREIVGHNSIEHAVDVLSERCPLVGRFVAYEFACDMTYVPGLLAEAGDACTWANPGPGARRGCNRVFRGDKDAKIKTSEYLEEMQGLFLRVKKDVAPKLCLLTQWPYEMRVIENALCEVDKYLRVRNGEGRPRAKYNATGE